MAIAGHCVPSCRGVHLSHYEVVSLQVHGLNIGLDGCCLLLLLLLLLDWRRSIDGRIADALSLY